MRQSRQLAVLLAILWFSSPARAALQWAMWGSPSGNKSTGTFADGQTVELTADFTGISNGEPAGLEYTAEPPVPGRPDNTNPPFTRMRTGASGVDLSPGAVVAALDLSALPSGAGVVFGLGDQKDTFVYRLELRDAAMVVLPLTGVVVTPHDLTYSYPILGSSSIADLNTLLSGDRLVVDQIHTAGGVYRHTGLTTFSNLHPATRHIILYAAEIQEGEGIQICLGVDLAGTTPTPRPTPTAPPGPCVGDCNGDGEVGIAEVIRMVNIGQGLQSLCDNCLAGDSACDCEITIDDIIKAVNNGLGGCSTFNACSLAGHEALCCAG